MNTNNEKGKALENAVRTIEEMLIARDPKLKGANITTEQNRKVTVKGVRYEIDVLIITCPETKFESWHIIECKNWKKPVGTDEVCKLILKKEQVGAQTAALVARGFTQDATNLAQEKGILLKEVSDDLPFSIKGAFISIKLEGGQVSLTYQDKQTNTDNLNLSEETPCRFYGSEVALGVAIEALIRSHLDQKTKEDPRRNLPGSHSGRSRIEYALSPQHLIVNDQSVQKLVAEIYYSVDVSYPHSTSTFSIKDSGGVCKLDYPKGTLGYDDLSLEITTNPTLS